MRCMLHPLTEVVGYCCKCGAFGCASCLTRYEGELYCKKDYKPIADKMAKEQRHEKALSRPQRQRLVVHTRDHEMLYGVSFSMNLRAEDFHLDLVDKHGEPQGETKQIYFEDLKAVYYVKSFDGKFDPDKRYAGMHEMGEEIVIDFSDGETLRGYKSQNYNERDPRFYMIPEDQMSNNISILVERRAVKEMYSVAESRRRRHDEADAYLQEHKVQGLVRDELMGDFYFEKREYRRSYKHYVMAHDEKPGEARIRSKMISAQYNVGAQYIKQRDYERALHCMRAVLRIDPEHERAKEKSHKLRRMIRRIQAGKTKSPNPG